MNHLHKDLQLKSGNIIEVVLNQQANVTLLDDLNYNNYKNGRKFTYYGGLAEVSPFHINTPYSGHWHLVIDLGGGSGHLEYSVKVI